MLLHDYIHFLSVSVLLFLCSMSTNSFFLGSFYSGSHHFELWLKLILSAMSVGAWKVFEEIILGIQGIVILSERNNGLMLIHT